LLVHCGDGVNDLLRVSLTREVQVLRVAGNVDRAGGSTLEAREVLELRGRRVLVTHGDMQGAHRDYDGLMDEARRLRCETVFFGHTHRPELFRGEITLFNPGEARRGMYGIVTWGDVVEYRHQRFDPGAPGGSVQAVL